MARSTGNVLANYVKQFLNLKKRKRRDLEDQDEINEIPDLPETHKNAFQGGERAILYALVENFLDGVGVDGKPCLLRTICEVSGRSMSRYGLIGEILKLFLR
jgi:hypothetical protein